jgi:hypothetical protein
MRPNRLRGVSDISKSQDGASKVTVDFETFVRAALRTGKAPKPAKPVKKRKAKK